MNIYISNIDICKMKTHMFDKYFISKREKTFIFADSGILEIKNNGEIWQMIINDNSRIDSVKLDKYELLIDKSTWNRTDLHFQVPVEHLQVRTTQYIYQTHKKSGLKLIIEEENNKITNLFFKTDLGTDIDKVKKDIITFLSLIK